MSNKFAVRLGRVVAGAAVATVLTGVGGGVALADEEAPAPDGTIQEVGGAVTEVEEATGVADVSTEVSDATGLTEIEEEAGVTKAEEGLGLG